MKYLFNLRASALCVFALQVGHSVQGADPNETPASSNKPQRELAKLVNQFCIKCHSSKDANADLNFETLLEPEGFARDRELWEASIEQIIQENMPPEGKMPPEATRKRMVDAIRSGIKNVDWDAVASPGDVPLPRLTSLEYANTLQDVVGLPIPFDDLLPVDLQGNSGFANDRAALTMGEVEIRGFLLAAERAARAAVATAEAENAGSVASEFVFESESGRFKTHWERDAKPFQYGGATVVEFDRWWGMKDQKLFHMVTIEHPGLYRFTARAANNLAGDRGRNYMRPFLKGPNKEAYRAARGALAFTVNGSASDQSSGVVVNSDKLRDHVTYVYLDEGPHEIGINYEFLRVPYVEGPPEKPKLPVPNEQFTRGDGFCSRAQRGLPIHRPQRSGRLESGSVRREEGGGAASQPEQ